MTLLTSNLNPINLRNHKPFYEVFAEYADKDISDLIKISTGFITVDSVLYILENIRRNNINALELVIGMHAFTGITRRQLEIIKMLDCNLRQESRGFVRICTAFPYHGKTYSFWKNGRPFASIVGSSNLDSILRDEHLQYEVDVLFTDQQILADITNLQQALFTRASKSLDDWRPTIITQPVFPPDYPDVEQIPLDRVTEFWRRATGPSFELKLKAEEKSNLNCTFGKGRENTHTKVVRPRPWYEVEIIVSSAVTSQRGFPYQREFFVVTKEGYKFLCQTQGDYSKNFRSKADLRILGMWIKGQMEEAGVLQVGERITNTIIQRFGKKCIKLISTDDPDLWLIELV